MHKNIDHYNISLIVIIYRPRGVTRGVSRGFRQETLFENGPGSNGSLLQDGKSSLTTGKGWNLL